MAMIMEVMESLDKLKSEPPCTPTPAGKHAHSFSAEMSIRKRPGIVTRTQKKALEALGPLEDDGELEPLEKERRVPSSKMEDMSKNEGRVQKWRTGLEMEDASRRAHTCP
jgi:hypothetical protein